MMNPEEIERLFREYVPGERVRAAMDIIYGDGGEIAEGTEGTVEVTRCHGVRALPLVRWDTGLRKATSTTALDPIERQELVEVELHSTEPSALEATRATIDMLPGGRLVERRGRYYVPSGPVAWMVRHQGYVRRMLPFMREARSGVAGACGVCGKERHEDGSPVTWRCRVCSRHVCRECTRVIPGSVPREYHEITLCSDACWEAAGRPGD